MLRVICVRTGTKFDKWWEDNLRHMVDTYSGLEYDEFVVMDEDLYDGVFNKLLMFDKYRDGQNIYFDLDVIIKGDCNHLLRNDLTTCYAWWRNAFHTPICSDIISWKGDQSYIYEKFLEDPEYYLFKYRLGMDQFLFENVGYNRYGRGDRYCTFQTVTEPSDEFDVYLFNQRHSLMREASASSGTLSSSEQAHLPWYSEFLLPD